MIDSVRHLVSISAICRVNVLREASWRLSDARSARPYIAKRTCMNIIILETPICHDCFAIERRLSALTLSRSILVRARPRDISD